MHDVAFYPGEDEGHPQRGASRHDLGDEQPRKHQGQLDEAAKMKRILGEEHPDLGDEQPRKHARRPRPTGRGGGDEAHPRRGASRHDLGDEQPRKHRGQLDEAAKMKRILGEGHPDTISAMNPANTLGDQGLITNSPKH
ncbi:MAG: hypothetical protein M1839_001660 [Geoglossum umbratile]|nr:MAG: hypothetical protein M1839_001660 [Geoglossum umbratile]